MALVPKIFGIAANSISIDGGPTGLVIETFDIDASATEKVLTGNNPGQTPVDIRLTEKKETVSFSAEFGTYVEPDAVMGKDCSFSATSDVKDTSGSPASPTVSGKITSCKLSGRKGDWWVYDITVTKSGEATT